jgi:biotin synthase-like enzyme
MAKGSTVIFGVDERRRDKAENLVALRSNDVLTLLRWL